MTNFIPEQPKNDVSVPVYEDTNSESGWQGQATTKSIETLKSDVAASISRLGGMVTGFQKGLFQVGTVEREGFRIHYSLETPSGGLVPGRIDIAALPVRKYQNKEKSLKMALYMMKIAFDGMWFQQRLSPGYAPLMPFMLAKGDQTISQLWCDSAIMQNLLPPGDPEFIDGKVVEVR